MTEPAKQGPPIRVHAERCAGCLICELRCSLRFEKAFNPGRARIRVRRLVGAESEYSVELDEGCDRCGICARHCPYGALVQVKEGGGA
ncbi:MAG: 4Fe-4S binding protein [Proteobacteria bacterium]|nr:4Fe-4S binding protein [Pseudomonadota bacterium]